MTTERAFVIGLEPTPEVLSLVDDVRSAAERARKADPGDRSDVIRFESLAAQLEHLAATSESSPRSEVAVPAAERLMILGGDETHWEGDAPAEVRTAAGALLQQ